MRISEIEEAKQSGIYVGVTFSDKTIKNLADYQKKHTIPNPSPTATLHTTILHSREYVDWRPKTDLDLVVTPEHSEIVVFDTKEGARCLVWKYESEYLNRRFRLGIAQGATFDFDTYKPHITLSYDIGDFDIGNLPVPDFNIEIVGEYIKPLDENWVENVT